jgi:WW domain binding protein 11
MRLFLFIILGKEARKKELKKNKKQRQAVRTAVLKGKDPSQIIYELEKIDNMGMHLIRGLRFNNNIQTIIFFRVQCIPTFAPQ